MSTTGSSTPRTALGGFLAGVFSWVVVPLAIIIGLNTFVFQAFHVVGSSMVPTLQDGNYLIVSKVQKTFANAGRLVGKDGVYIPQRGQIVIFKYPQNPDLDFVKRVVGLPGDRVVVDNEGRVRVYNSAHPTGFNPDTSYEPNGTFTMIPTDVTVPPGNVFVLGDNRTPNGSSDSREWGLLPSDDILGVAALRLLPVNEMKVFVRPKAG